VISAELALELAKRHEWARTEVKPIDPITVDHPDLDIADAYAVQQAWVDLQIANGAHMVGRKIGLTSRAMQQQMKIDEPDFGALLDYMIMRSGVQLRHADYVDPKLEVEIAFIIGQRLSGDSVTVEEVLEATQYIQPALELIDARSYRVHPVTKQPRTIVDTIADNAADAGVILGGNKVAPADVDRDAGRVRPDEAAERVDDVLQQVAWVVVGAGIERRVHDKSAAKFRGQSNAMNSRRIRNIAHGLAGIRIDHDDVSGTGDEQTA